MASVLVVLVLPVADGDPRVGQGPEQVDVQAFVAETAVERLNVSVPPRLAGRDEGEPDTFAGSVGHRGAGQLGAVVAAQHLRVAAVAGQPVKLVDQPVPGEGACDEAAEALAGVLVDDGDDLDRSAVGGGVELEVDRPHPVRAIRDWVVWCCGRTDPLTAPRLRPPHPFVAPQPLNLLVVHRPALAAGVLVGTAESPAGMLLRIVP